MESVEKAVAKSLLDIKAVMLRPETPFTWASGWLSPIYCDNINNIPINANPSLFCINDTPNITDDIRKQNWDFLNRMFPDKSQFEK